MFRKISISALTLVAAGCLIYFLIIPAFSGRLLISPSLQLGPVTFRWYGLIMAMSVMLGYLVARKNSWRFGIAISEIDNFSFWLVITSFLGARIYFVLFAWKYFAEYPAEIVKVWHGGISIFGALITGVVFTYFWSRKKAYSFKQLFDLIALAVPLSQALGRWGNFFNQEAYGEPTALAWKMYIQPQFRSNMHSDENFFHPTFLYESLLLIGLFFLMKKLLGRVNPGVLGLIFLAGYSLIRFFVEPLRLDSVWFHGIRVDQLIALAVIIISGIFILRWQFGLGQKKVNVPE